LRASRTWSAFGQNFQNWGEISVWGKTGKKKNLGRKRKIVEEEENGPQQIAPAEGTIIRRQCGTSPPTEMNKTEKRGKIEMPRRMGGRGRRKKKNVEGKKNKKIITEAQRGGLFETDQSKKKEIRHPQKKQPEKGEDV